MAVDPLTAKLLAQAAIKAATDEESRKRMIILAPVIFLLLFITFILYLITSPFSMLAQWLVGGEADAIDNLQKDYGYNQNIGIFDNDYFWGSIGDYENIVFQDCSTEVVYYNQLDERWKNQAYGMDKIGTHGCGPTAMAMVVSSLTDEMIDPIGMADWSYEHGYWCQENGSYHSLVPAAVANFGLSVEGIKENEGEKLVEALSNGKLVVAIMSKGHFTKSGHFIVLRGITAEGKILVADPASYKRSEKEWDLDIILNEARKRAGAGGPFWAIGI